MGVILWKKMQKKERQLIKKILSIDYAKSKKTRYFNMKLNQEFYDLLHEYCKYKYMSVSSFIIKSIRDEIECELNKEK